MGILALGAFFLFAICIPRGTRTADVDEAALSPSTGNPTSGKEADGRPGPPSKSGIGLVNEREQDELRRTGLVGHVFSGAAPLVNATVHFTVLSTEDIEWELAWFADDWGRLNRESMMTRTGPGGLFEFDAPLASPSGAVVWATHPDHLAAAQVLGKDRESWPHDVRLVLDPSDSIDVFVRESGGRAVAGAIVEQFGLTPRGASRTTGAFNERLARRLMTASRTTGPDGTASFEPLPGEQIFSATHADLASVSWRGPARERVVLTLHPTFEVRGQVSIPSWEHLNYVGERRITIAAQTRNLWRTLHTVRSVENGEYGPVVLPLVESDRYRIRLEGSPIIPVEVFFEPPRAGARLTLDLATEIGVNVSFRVSDREDRLIPEAVVKVMWQSPERLDHWNFVERSCNESGLINVWSLPAGAMKFEASAPGYVPFISGIEATSTYDHSYAQIRLEQAGRLRGRCTHEGQPVTDFEVIVWQPALVLGTSPTTFFDREDGRFEIDTVPVGEFWVTASSADLVGGEPLQVSCPPGGEVEVELELTRGLLGHGQVVDAGTGDPIADAEVQIFVKGGITPVARWGLPRPVEADGTFEFAGFVPGVNHLRVQAPGYSRNVQQQELAPGGTIDWGTIAMERSSAFRIELERADTSLRVEVSGEGSQVIPAHVFTEDNTLVVPDVSSGNYYLKFMEGSGVETYLEMELVPGQNWILRERIDGPNTLTVEVQPETGHSLPQLSRVEVAYLSSQGFRHERAGVPRNGVARFEGIDSERVTVHVYDGLGEPLATSGGVFAGADLHLVLTLGGEPFDLRVIDPEGEPIPEVRVLVTDPESPGSVWITGTDASGECRIIGVPERAVTVHLEHASHGSHYGIALDGTSRSAEVVLDGRGKLDLLVRDGDEPLADIFCRVVDTNGTPLQPQAKTDAGGRAVLAALAVAPYHLSFHRSDCWEVQATVTAKLAGDPTPVQVRRLADLELQILSASGLPVHDLAVELTSLEFEAAVAGWLEEGRVRSEGLRTDLRGQIRVERLPRGSYRWRLTPPSGEPLEGQIELEPGQNPPVRLVLPE